MQLIEVPRKTDPMTHVCRQLRRTVSNVTRLEAYAALVTTLASVAREEDIPHESIVKDLAYEWEAA